MLLQNQFLIFSLLSWLINPFSTCRSCFWLYCHSSSSVLVLTGPSPCMNSGEQLSRAWPEVLCGSATDGCNSSTLKPLSGDSSECLQCGSLDSLHPSCSFTPFSFAFCLPLFFEFFHSHRKKNCPHPITAVVSKHTQPCDHFISRFFFTFWLWVLGFSHYVATVTTT